MSEAILKKKTQHVKNPISGKDKNGFSLNGGYRNKGRVGQNNFARANGTCSTNDPNIIKRSTMNTKGFIDATIEHPTDAFLESNKNCNSQSNKKWVKDLNADSQGQHIRTLKIKSICANTDPVLCHIDPYTCLTVCDDDIDNCNPCSSKSHFIGTRKIITNMITKKKRGTLSSSDYTTGFLQTRQCLPPPPCKQHFPMAFNHNGCNINYLTPQHAIRSRVLPSNHVVAGPCIKRQRANGKWKYSEDATLVLLNNSIGTLQNTDGIPTKFCDHICYNFSRTYKV